MRTVSLRGPKAAGRVALVDDEDYELVMQYKWYVDEQQRKGRNTGPYAWARLRPGQGAPAVKMHTLVTGWPLVDHINHNGLDNQRHNLRPATKPQNQYNSRPNARGTSPYKGVSWDRWKGKWHAAIQANRKHHFLGYFTNEQDAARAYDAAATQYFGAFAYLNFPDAP